MAPSDVATAHGLPKAPNDSRQEETRNELLAQLERLVEENRRLAELYWQAEKRNSALLGLYVAALRLHASLDREDLLLALQEVLASLLGCEEAAVYELEAGVLKPVAFLGVAAPQAPELAIGEGVVGRAVETGTLYIAPDGERQGEISACAPLILGGRATGAIALYGLLPQKRSLDERDRELLEMLSTHAALALHVSSPRPAQGASC